MCLPTWWSINCWLWLSNQQSPSAFQTFSWSKEKVSYSLNLNIWMPETMFFGFEILIKWNKLFRIISDFVVFIWWLKVKLKRPLWTIKNISFLNLELSFKSSPNIQPKMRGEAKNLFANNHFLREIKCDRGKKRKINRIKQETYN